MQRPLLLHLSVFVVMLSAHAGAAPAASIDLKGLDRDDAAAEEALKSGDIAAALRYFDYFGHEQEDFARATLEYRLARQKLGVEVRAAFGRRAWGRAAALLGVPRRPRDVRGPKRTARREGNVLYVKHAGGGNEVPYVHVKGVWKVSVRDVLVAAVKARFGSAIDYEEADLYVLAGKVARVLRGRAGELSVLADDVRAKRITADELNAAVRRIREPSQQ